MKIYINSSIFLKAISIETYSLARNDIDMCYLGKFLAVPNRVNHNRDGEAGYNDYLGP